MFNPKMKQRGLDIDVIEKTTVKSRSFLSLKSKIFCEPTELCFLLYNLLRDETEISFIKLNFRVDDLDIYTAYDIASAIEECKKRNIKFVGFSEHLSLSHFLAISFCDFRICPPLVGHLSFTLNFKHFVLNESSKYFQSVKIGEKKLPLVEFDNEKLNEAALKAERELGIVIINKCISIILKAIPQTKNFKSNYSTAVELTEDNLLTHVCYEEYLTSNIPALKNIKWKYKGIRKTNFNSTFSKLKQRASKHFYILEIKSDYWDELNSLTDLRQQLTHIHNLKTAKGLLLIVNYKGGSYESADRIWCLVNILKKKFPVYVYIKVAASSGYCIASTGEKISINPCGYLGNVGTILFSPNYDNILNRFGIDVINNISSPLKNDTTTSAILNSRAQIAFTLFINRIAESRKLKIETVNNLMDGSNFNSTQSVENKFADNEETFISLLEKLRLENSKSCRFILVKKPESFMSRIINLHAINTMIKIFFK
jgi:ClpP class serine protease